MGKLNEKSRTVLERNKFFATTNVAGFGLIQSSNSRIETVIWYIVILVFFSLTIRSITILTNEYLSQEPIITVQLETWNGNLTDIYIEMDIMVPELYDEFYDDKFKYPFPYSYKRSLSEDLNEVLTAMDSKDKVIGPKVKWSYVLLPLMSRFTTMMQKLEFPDFYYKNDTQIEEKLKQQLHMNGVFPYILKFIAHCNQLEVTTAELINEWFNQIIKMVFKQPIPQFPRYDRSLHADTMELQVQLMNKTDYYSLFEVGTSFSLIGFRLTDEMLANSKHWIVTYREFVDILLSSGVFGGNFATDQTVEWYNEKLCGTKKPKLFVYRNFLAIRSVKPLLKIEFGQRIEREVKMVYSFRSITDTCNKTTPKWKCYTECLAKFTKDKCHCTPRSFHYDLGDDSSCSLENYLQCGRNGQVYIHEEKHCTKSCFKHCNEDILSFDRVFENAQTRHGKDTLELVLQPTFTKHPVFQEFYAQSSTGFWADLGGAFDFWIGASVISAVHLIVYLIKQLIYGFQSETKTGRNMRHLVRGFQSTGEDPAQMVALLSLGMTQKSPQNNDRQIDENSTETVDEKIEIMKNIIERQQQKIENLEKDILLQQREQKQEMDNLKQIVQQLLETKMKDAK